MAKKTQEKGKFVIDQGGTVDLTIDQSSVDYVADAYLATYRAVREEVRADDFAHACAMFALQVKFAR